MGVDMIFLANASGRRLRGCVLCFLILHCHLEAVVGVDMTFVANASGRPLRVYYSPSRMTLDEVDINFGTRMSGSGISVSAQTKMAVRRDSHVRYIHVPPGDYAKILDEGSLFVTVFVEERPGSDECLNIAQNFYIPSDRSFIVTPGYAIKFQRYAASIWMDEDGVRY